MSLEARDCYEWQSLWIVRTYDNFSRVKVSNPLVVGEVPHIILTPQLLFRLKHYQISTEIIYYE